MTIRIDIKNSEGEGGKIAILEFDGKPAMVLHPNEGGTVYVHDKTTMWVREDWRKDSRRENRFNRRR